MDLEIAIAHVREACGYLAQLAELENFTNERTLGRWEMLLSLAGGERGPTSAYRGATLASARKGTIEGTLRFASAYLRARPEPDHEIDRAIESLTWSYTPVEKLPTTPRPRALVLTSQGADVDRATLRSDALLASLRSAGWDVAMLFTNPAAAEQTERLARYARDGIVTIFFKHGPYGDQIRGVLAALEKAPAHVACFAVDRSDVAATLFAYLGIARTHVAVPHGNEMLAGRFTFSTVPTESTDEVIARLGEIVAAQVGTKGST
jgi:hypothetical protein